MNKNILFASLFSLSVYQAQAQFKISQDLNGTPVETKASTDILGSPYLYDKFSKGHVLEENNTYYDNMDIRYDIQLDRVTFKSKYGVEYAFKNPVKEFKISPSAENSAFVTTFRNGFPAIEGFSDKSFYQVLNDGETVVLKKLSKSVVESTPYGAAKTQKNMVTGEQYFIFNKGKMTRVKKDKKSVLNALENHRPELEKFISDQSLNLKSDKDLTALLSYYNTLKG